MMSRLVGICQAASVAWNCVAHSAARLDRLYQANKRARDRPTKQNIQAAFGSNTRTGNDTTHTHAHCKQCQEQCAGLTDTLCSGGAARSLSRRATYLYSTAPGPLPLNLWRNVDRLRHWPALVYKSADVCDERHRQPYTKLAMPACLLSWIDRCLCSSVPAVCALGRPAAANPLPLSPEHGKSVRLTVSLCSHLCRRSRLRTSAMHRHATARTSA